jgi:predicted translin family RNA/ssDNA-binding protein
MDAKEIITAERDALIAANEGLRKDLLDRTLERDGAREECVNLNRMLDRASGIGVLALKAITAINAYIEMPGIPLDFAVMNIVAYAKQREEELDKANTEIERLQGVVTRLEDSLIASRHNEAIAREVRDSAVLRIFKVAKLCKEEEVAIDSRHGHAIETLKREVRISLAICPKCDLLTPCACPKG